MTQPRVLALVPMVLVATLLTVLATTDAEHEPGREGVGRSAPDRAGPLAVLRTWDRRRAAAWRRADPAALRSLYVDGSAAGRADRAALTAYVDRGLRVTGMRMQVARAEVRAESGRRLVLLITDRLVGAVAVGRGHRVALPEDRWSRRRVVLVRPGEAWRVAEVADQPSPVASTDSTSGSANS